ncbi:MAG: glycoside hydrolase family 13 protein [Eubacteriales bacterium]
MKCFDSRDLRYKAPYGAVPSGEKVKFHLYPRRNKGFNAGRIVANFEGQGVIELPLKWQSTELGFDCFGVTLPTAKFVGLVWYHFVLSRTDGVEEVIRPDHTPYDGLFQLTVYQEEQVPTWYGEGMTYQIFPDRFNRTEIPDPTGMVGERVVHQDWSDSPDYLPNEHGEVRNRDYFGGNLKGIIEKLDYLQKLGVETIYFCPIFEASENHRYGTADYDKIDPMLGTEEDFKKLCDGAHKRKMRVMLDGVFNHTGFVSRYFNGDGFYDTEGATQSKESPYYPWFDFKEWPEEYDAWWGIYSLPSCVETNVDYQNFIYDDENSVVRRWLRSGADGWRLDVADELPDEFVAGIHAAARAEKPDAVVIGEVWEDGSTKVAYGVRRKHVLGGHCDGLMNYPFRWAVLNFMNSGDPNQFIESMETLRENYPKFAFYSAMNALGTHDTLRILTLLSVGSDCQDQSKTWRFRRTLSQKERKHGIKLLKTATALLYCFPGSPTIYYGDEIGMEGFEDPFNRATYPWGDEDTALLRWFTKLGELRKKSKALREGDISYLDTEQGVLAFKRTAQKETILCVCNQSDTPQEVKVEGSYQVILSSVRGVEDGSEVLEIPAHSGSIFKLLSK